MVSMTSIFAYKSIKKLGDKQRQVYSTISRLGTATNEQISDALKWPINRVTGRVNELSEAGLIKKVGVRPGKTGRSHQVWQAKEGDELLEEIKLNSTRVEYHVRVPDLAGGEYDLIFDTRKDARDYKKLLAKSQRKLKSKIIRREFDDGYIAEEKEIS